MAILSEDNFVIVVSVLGSACGVLLIWLIAFTAWTVSTIKKLKGPKTPSAAHPLSDGGFSNPTFPTSEPVDKYSDFKMKRAQLRNEPDPLYGNHGQRPGGHYPQQNPSFSDELRRNVSQRPFDRPQAPVFLGDTPKYPGQQRKPNGHNVDMYNY